MRQQNRGQTHGQAQVDLSPYDGAMVAVAFPPNSALSVFRGRAAYKHDHDLGRVLVIASDNDTANLIIAEEYWNGQITPDTEHGCQFLFVTSTA